MFQNNSAFELLWLYGILLQAKKWRWERMNEKIGS